MYRIFEKYLLSRKNNKKCKPLIIRGARQVGKTFIVDKFGKENYKYYLKINLEQNENLRTVFKTKNPQLIINELSVLYNIPIIPGETLLFIDEIQTTPEAIVSLRYFYEQMPDLHIITAGSLLDHTLNEMQYSMPVGRVEFAYMYPLNFNEFLIANNENGLVDYIENFTFEKAFSKAIHDKISKYLRLYFFIGGMPEAVKTYIDTKNLIEVEKVHSSIITSLQYDFAKYGTRKQQEYLKECLNYAAGNTGKKVKYVNINRNISSANLKEALVKLEMSKVIHFVTKTQSSKVPINQYSDKDTFKTLFIDIGLSNYLSDIRLTDIRNLITDHKGSLAEQFVGQEFIASGHFFEEEKLWYWTRESKNSNAEIDFLYQKGNKIFPVEVKAGKRGTLKSLHVYLSEKKEYTGIRFNSEIPSISKNLKANTKLKGAEQVIIYKLISLPLYFAGIIRRYDF